MATSKFEILTDRVKKDTDINTITISIDSTSIIVDDYSIPKCLVQVGYYYGVFHVYEGDNSLTKLTVQDLKDFNIYNPMDLYSNDDEDNYIYPLVGLYKPKVNDLNGDTLNVTLEKKMSDEDISRDFMLYNLIDCNVIKTINELCEDKGLTKEE